MAEEDDLYWEDQRIGLLNRMTILDCPMVVIRDSADSVKDDLSVFPPINHENLQVASFTNGDDRIRDSPSESSSPSSSSRGSLSSSSFSLSPSDTDGQPPWTASDFDRKSPWQPSETDVKSPPSDAAGKSPCKPLCRSSREVDIVHCWWKHLLVRVIAKFQDMVTWFSGGNFSSITGTLRSLWPILAIATWWWIRVRARRRRCKEETVDHLRNVIKEKDERIVQLLHQIAQMNDLVVKHHKNAVSGPPN